MLKIKSLSQFKKDLRKFTHKKNVLQELDTVLKLLVKGEKLPAKYCDHSLIGSWNMARDCHIKPDVLLIYRINDQESLLELLRIGSHSELFG